MTGTKLIVGAGEAGLQVAITLRDQGCDGRVVLVGDEPRPPYQRPPLSKGYLAGTVMAEQLELRDRSFLQERGIELITGHRVTNVRLTDDGGEAFLDDDTRIDFDGLALATGAKARALPIPGADADGVLTLRSMADAETLKDKLATACDVVVVGGGFIGLEVAATARDQGKRVTVIEAEDQLLGRVLAEPVATHVQAFHEAAGTTVLLAAKVTGLETANARVTGVEVADGSTVPADLVVLGIGAEPRVDLATTLGLQVERGVVTDETGRTEHPRVVAVGDCAAQPHPHHPGGLLTLESVNNAQDQARTAARALIGLDPGPRGVPWFWSNQGTLKLQMAGISDGHDEYVVRDKPGGGGLTILYYRQGGLIAGDTVDAPRDFNAIKNALAKRGNIDPLAAQAPDVSLKSLLELPH